jgi:tetratricopeptide (TPR) repeat protein
MGRQSRNKTLRPTVATTPSGADAAPAPQPRTALPVSYVLVALVVIGLCLVIYAQVRGHQFLTYDDGIYITENVIVQRGLTAEGIRWALTSLDFNWHPMTWLTHMLDVQFFGMNAGSHLLMNVMFHIANSLLLLALLTRMTGMFWRSAAVAALWAVHPLHVESVAWIAERKDVLSTLFLLLTVWFYVSWTRNRSSLTYALMLVLFILGLASKGMLVTLPFALLLLDYWPLARLDLNDRATIVKRVMEKIPLFVLAAGGIVMTVIAQRTVGAIVTIERISLAQRAGTAITAYGRYLWKTIVPAGLANPYPYVPLTPAMIVGSIAVLLGITALVITLRKSHRYLFTGWFWFIGTLVPVIGLVQIGFQSMADRYTYIPHIGLSIAVVWAIAEVARRNNAQAIAATAAVIAVAAFTVVAHKQVGRWRDSETLFDHALKVTQGNVIAHLHVGTSKMGRAEYDQALQHFRAAHQLDPDRPEPRDHVASALIELSRVDRARGDEESAMKRLEEASALNPAEKTRAAIALARNDVAKAIELYTAQASTAKSGDEAAKAQNDLGAALASAGRDEEAIAAYRKAIEIAPRQYDARMNLGAILSRMERNDEAIENFKIAVTLQPASVEPHVYLALAYFLEKRYEEAKTSAERAYTIDPKASNLKLTTAMRIPFKETNIQDFIGFVESKRQAPR